MSRFLSALRPLIRVMPEVKAPDRKVSFREKFGWTAIILLLYLIMAQLPLFGIDPQQGMDYFFWMRVILASNRGTLMELGIGPIVTAGLIMQLLVGSQLIKVDMSDPYMRSLYTGAQKVLAILMTAFQALAYIFAGAYGQLGTGPGTIGLGQAILVFVQLMFAGVVVVLMDEMIQKGWGLGSGVSLFIMANVCGQIIWNLFSVVPAQAADLPGFVKAGTNDWTWYTGIIPFILENLGGLSAGGTISNTIFPTDVYDGGTVCNPFTIWFRPLNPRASLSGVFVTFAVFIFVIWVESFRVNIPLQYARYRGFRGQYPIKLLYVSNIPVIFTQALYANILFITQILWTNPTLGLSDPARPINFWFHLIARYDPAPSGNYLTPQAFCLVWFLTPPTGFGDLFGPTGVIRAVGYALVLMGLCAGFARLWIDVSGISPRDVANQLIGAGMQVPGFRRSPAVIEKILNRYIPVVAVLGGLVIGALAAFADFFGALSTGIGILLAVGIMRQYFEILAKEQLSEMHPMMRGLLGMG